MTCRTTHHKGCDCWEARRDAEIARLREVLTKIVAIVGPECSSTVAIDDVYLLATDALFDKWHLVAGDPPRIVDGE
jgi:hypothetical protein